MATEPCTHSYRGIRKRKWGKWVAEIRAGKICGKRLRISLGSYFTPEAAARAYDAALFILRGHSASTFNFHDTQFNAVVRNLARTDHPSADDVRRAAMAVGSAFDSVRHPTSQMAGASQSGLLIGLHQVAAEEERETYDAGYLFPSPERISLEEVISNVADKQPDIDIDESNDHHHHLPHI